MGLLVVLATVYMATADRWLPGLPEGLAQVLRATVPYLALLAVVICAALLDYAGRCPACQKRVRGHDPATCPQCGAPLHDSARSSD
ncbi:MAG: hypothetical protein E1N59_465 [Puniceicoccaceae bacterium 5H]|nr:MAG: hypothetical protein E1N59_465 [Puniceicoccaceae bacterium 5H]